MKNKANYPSYIKAYVLLLMFVDTAVIGMIPPSSVIPNNIPKLALFIVGIIM